jgi:hypothetical protein
MKCAEILALTLSVKPRDIPMHATRLDRRKQSSFGYWLLYNPSKFGNSSTTEIPDITGMQELICPSLFLFCLNSSKLEQ